MTRYDITFSKESEKFLKKTDTITRKRILEAIFVLSVNPYEYNGATKLTGMESQHRIRIGKYRVVYELKDDVLTILVLNIDSRGGVYK